MKFQFGNFIISFQHLNRRILENEHKIKALEDKLKQSELKYSSQDEKIEFLTLELQQKRRFVLKTIKEMAEKVNCKKLI